MRNSSYESNDSYILLTGFSIMLNYNALQQLSPSTLLISSPTVKTIRLNHIAWGQLGKGHLPNSI